MLEAYLTLKQGLGSLKLESMGKGTLAEAMRIRTGPPHEDADLGGSGPKKATPEETKELLDRLRGEGF